MRRSPAVSGVMPKAHRNEVAQIGRCPLAHHWLLPNVVELDWPGTWSPRPELMPHAPTIPLEDGRSEFWGYRVAAGVALDRRLPHAGARSASSASRWASVSWPR